MLNGIFIKEEPCSDHKIKKGRRKNMKKKRKEVNERKKRLGKKKKKTYLMVGKLIPRLFAIGEDFPKDNPVTPNI